jgi:hypothetical protein
MMIVRPQQRFNSSFRFIGKFGLILFAAAFFLLFHFPTAASALKEDKKILILFPGQSELAAYPLTERAIKSAFAASTEFRIEYFTEYMDCYRNSDQTHYRKILELYRHKYSGKNIVSIIVFSTPALMLSKHDDNWLTFIPAGRCFKKSV